MNNNPFIINSYANSTNFCNRNEISDLLMTKITLKENILLVSPNGIGKTSLIKHLFYQLDQSNSFNTFYLDLFRSSISKEMVGSFISTVLDTFINKSQKKTKKLNELVFGKSSRDNHLLNGFSEDELVIKITAVLNFLNSQKKATILAFDNFETVNQFSNPSFYETIFSQVQKLDKIQIILAGTENSPLVDGFTKVSLIKIPEDVYKRFLSDLFNESDITVTKKSLSLIYDWADGETAAIQHLCSKLWMSKIKKIKSGNVIEAIDDILNENMNNLRIIKNLLSSYQWRLLNAIAREGIAKQATSSSFMQKYQLNAPSSVKTALTALIEKELLIRDGASYKVSNVILSKGLAAL